MELRKGFIKTHYSFDEGEAFYYQSIIGQHATQFAVS